VLSCLPSAAARIVVVSHLLSVGMMLRCHCSCVLRRFALLLHLPWRHAGMQHLQCASVLLHC
jgi:hypothetical protein